MKKHYYFAVLCTVLTTLSLSAQNRSFDGSNNNMQNPTWGAASSVQTYPGGLDYADGMDAPGGADRPNSRELSNFLFAQGAEELITSPIFLSDFVWSFGQFLDHDITLFPESETESVDINIPACDPYFDPFCTGVEKMSIHRSTAAAGTGVGTNQARKAINAISSFIDGSNIYGSDEIRANYLRSFMDGKMKISAGNMLPYNTTSGEINGDRDPFAPFMAMMTLEAINFVAGDIRANEQPSLLGLHTLFVREHNRLCDELKAENPSWNDETLYHRARKIVGGQLQAITYNEFLPALGVNLPAYSGYDNQVNPGIGSAFSTAAFRMGHTMVSEHLMVMDESSNEMEEVHLIDAFFNPSLVGDVGLEPFFMGMAHKMQQSFDTKMVHTLRNFLFGPPGAGGMDLAAINIERGRERGVPSYNALRAAFGLEPYTDMEQITDDALQVFRLSSIYDSVDEVDAWVGMLSEKKDSDKEVGELTIAIMKQQFEALRAGDRFFFMNDPTLSADLRNDIDNTTLSEILLRNTDISELQENVFIYEPLETVTTYAGIGLTSELKAYPNPAQDFVHLSFEGQSNGDISLSLQNVAGQVINEWSENISTGKNELLVDLGAISEPGIYFLQLAHDDFHSVVKVSVQ